MTKPKHYKIKNHLDRDSLNLAVDVADKMQEYETMLIEMLYEIDLNRYYVLYGFNSLMGFCNRALNLSRTQSQRIVTNVRRHVAGSNGSHRSKDPHGSNRSHGVMAPTDPFLMDPKTGMDLNGRNALNRW